MEHSVKVPENNKNRTYDPEILHLGIYLREMKSLSCRDICNPLFIVALFTVAKTWKQLYRENIIQPYKRRKLCHLQQHE